MSPRLAHEEVWKDEARVAHLERTIGQQQLEINFLKKVIEKLKELDAEERVKRR